MGSAFAGTDLREWLDSRGVDTLTIVGYMTHNCDAATIYQASHDGLQVEFLVGRHRLPAVRKRGRQGQRRGNPPRLQHRVPFELCRRGQHGRLAQGGQTRPAIGKGQYLSCPTSARARHEERIGRYHAPCRIPARFFPPVLLLGVGGHRLSRRVSTTSRAGRHDRGARQYRGAGRHAQPAPAGAARCGAQAISGQAERRAFLSAAAPARKALTKRRHGRLSANARACRRRPLSKTIRAGPRSATANNAASLSARARA